MVDAVKCYESAVLAVKNGKPINEDVGDWLFKQIRDKKQELIPPGVDGKFINRQAEILRLIRNGYYDKAIAMAKENGVKDSTIFDQHVLFGRNKFLGIGRYFGKRYYKIPFIFAALASVVGNQTSVPAIAKLIPQGFRRIFIEGGLGNGASLNLKAEESTRFNDICSFLLTHDGKLEIPPYSDTVDISLVELFKALIGYGWKPGNIATTAPGLLYYLITGDFVLSLKFLENAGFFKPSVGLIDNFGVKQGTKCYDYFKNSESHDFKLHDTEVTTSGDAIIGGEFHDKMLSLGYDIKDKQVQPVPFTTFFVLAQELSLIHNKYAKNGEKLNTNKITLFTNANIEAAAKQIKDIIKKYTDTINDPVFKKATPEQKNVIVQQFIARIGQVVGNLEYKANASLAAIGLPPIKFQFKTALNPSSNRLYADMNMFCKELNDAVRLSRSVF